MRVRRVVVVGGGVMGSAAAWSLTAAGAEVTLLEQFEPRHTRGSSHGSSRIFRLAYQDPFYVALAARALPLWRELEQQSGRGVLTLTGAVDHGPEHVTTGLHAALAGGGHPHRRFPAAEAMERWPALRFETDVLFHPDAGRVHADDATSAFQTVAAARGADIRHHTPVTAVRRLGAAKVEVVTAGGASLIADTAVVAVGAWAPRFAQTLRTGLPPMRITQEQPLHFAVPDALQWPSFVHYGAAGLPTDVGAYGLGSVDGVKVGLHAVGAEVDPERADRPIDAAAARRVEEYARAWVPGLGAAVGTASTCLYTLTPDHDFVIDRDGPIVVLAGFSGHGFKFAPVIGQLAADLVDGRPAPPRFARARFT